MPNIRISVKQSSWVKRKHTFNRSIVWKLLHAYMSLEEGNCAYGGWTRAGNNLAGKRLYFWMGAHKFHFNLARWRTLHEVRINHLAWTWLLHVASIFWCYRQILPKPPACTQNRWTETNALYYRDKYRKRILNRDRKSNAQIVLN